MIRPISWVFVLFVTTPCFATSAPSGGPAPLRDKPTLTPVGPGLSDQIIEVKFAHGSGVRLEDGLFVGVDPTVDQVNAILEALSATARRTFAQSENWLEDFRMQGEALSGLVLHDLNLFFCIDLPEAGGASALCDVLNTLGVVEIAWPAPIPMDPIVPPALACTLIGATTPDFSTLQAYRGPAPVGIDAVHANTFSGGDGTGVRMIDCETGWTDDHEDLAGKTKGKFVGYVPAPYPWDHGTAVLGELVGENNTYGVLGIARDADVRLSTHSPVGGVKNIPGAVMNAAAACQAGDVIIVEIQCFGGPPGPYPCEYEPSVFATVQAATANGIHVVAASGNGNNNLDSPAYGGAFDLGVRDSGAVLVGASNGGSLVKADFSNYGARLTSHGWGYNVATTGYGDLHSGGTPKVYYTSSFSGTSSATPMVAGAIADLAAIHREAFGFPMAPLTMRTLLKVTGTPQAGAGTIGTRPNLKAAIRSMAVPELEVTGTLLPGGFATIVMRGTPGDTFGLLWSPALLADPVLVSPAGWLHLDPFQVRVLLANAVLDGAGKASVAVPIPAIPVFSGFVSHMQGYGIFASKPGVASFSNYVTVKVQ